MAKKFYKCAKCGNIISKYVDSGVPVVCCGEPMMELVANSTDAAGEKHVPVVEVNGNKVIVKVGEVAPTVSTGTMKHDKRAEIVASL